MDAVVKPTCNAYVKFAEESSVTPALSLNGTVVEGHRIRVDAVGAGPVVYDPTRSIFVGNLPRSVLEDQVWSHFEGCGKVQAVRVVRDKEMQVGKGIAFVLFERGADATTALTLDETDFEGRVIRVTRVTRNGASGPGAGGNGGTGKKDGGKKKEEPAKKDKKKERGGGDDKRGEGSSAAKKPRTDGKPDGKKSASAAASTPPPPPRPNGKKPRHETSSRKDRRKAIAIAREKGLPIPTFDKEKAPASSGGKGTGAPGSAGKAPAHAPASFSGAVAQVGVIPNLGKLKKKKGAAAGMKKKHVDAKTRKANDDKVQQRRREKLVKRNKASAQQ